MYPRGPYAGKWNSNTLQFFATVFHRAALSGTIDYVNKFTREIASQLFVKLPVTPSGTPDWNYMEEYMKKIEKRTEQALDTLSAVEQVAV